ncbi:flippase [Bacillus sp. DNRA2]|uniref:flippase n=1 Tax=Bacillus sp. DNRA2 TaxID=2723053 RepID=UPI00145CF5DE|nr:flippase [Bacillus sp. DNRA2]NMD70178.1 flippase [Bacillus sp. DNRA2]
MKKNGSTLINGKFFQNTGWIVGERVFQMSLSIIVGMLTARYLGPSDFGIINYTASFTAFFTSICSLGLEGVIVKELVEDPEEEGRIIGTGIAMRLISSLLSMVAILISISILNSNNNVILIVAMIQSIALIFRAFELIEFWYQSQLQSKYSTLIKSVSYLIMSSYKVILLLLGKSVEWFAFSTVVDVIIIMILYIISYYKQGGKKLKVSYNLAIKMLSQSYPFILSGIMVALYVQMDKIMIGQFLNQEKVGLYTVAATICGFWVFIPTAFINSARPLIMNLKNENEEQYLMRLKQLYAFIIWLGIIFALVVTIFSKWIVLILYGQAYIGSTTTLIISVWSSILSVLGSARTIWILCEKYNKYIPKYLIWGIVISVMLNVYLIPKIGIEGAAIAQLTAQIVTNLIAPLFYNETRIHTKYIMEAFLLRGVKINMKGFIRNS